MWIVKILAKLPPFILYGIADVLYFFFYRLFPVYRKKLVIKNLSRSFPEKSPREIEIIAAKFYRRFFEMLAEMLIFINIDKNGVKKMVHFTNPELLQNLGEERPFMLLGAHFISWEIQGLAVDELTDYQCYYVYQRLSNPSFDKLMYEVRGKFGAIGVLQNDTARTIIRNKSRKALFHLLADQSPVLRSKRYWAHFLNQQTAFFLGIGQLAAKSNMPVVVGFPRQIKRGKYEFTWEYIAEGDHHLNATEILDRYIDKLEKEIISRPQDWLWTHNRWKKKPQENDVFQNRTNE